MNREFRHMTMHEKWAGGWHCEPRGNCDWRVRFIADDEVNTNKTSTGQMLDPTKRAQQSQTCDIEILTDEYRQKTEQRMSPSIECSIRTDHGALAFKSALAAICREPEKVWDRDNFWCPTSKVGSE
jgi:hypothetical protein